MEGDWHLNKGVTISIIAALLTMFGSLVGIYVSMREDIATIKAQQASMIANDARQERMVEQSITQFRADVDKLRGDLMAEVKALTIVMMQHQAQTAKEK